METLIPLVAAMDAVVLDEMVRLAGAAGCRVECVPDPVAALDRWADAPLIVLDEAMLAEIERAEVLPPPRAGVMVACKSAPAPETWRRAFRAGATKVFSLPDDEVVLLAAFAALIDGPGEPGGRVLAMVGGRGGAGASVLAAAVAVGAANAGEKVLLLDCDPLGGGLETLLGEAKTNSLKWTDVRAESGRISSATLDSALPARRYGSGTVSVLSCADSGGEPSELAMGAVVDAARRSGRLVVCDLPRQLGPASLVAAGRADLVVLVVPPEIRACAAAKRVRRRLLASDPRVRLVVRGPGPDGLSAEQAAELVDVPLLTSMRTERAVAKSLERGEFRCSGELSTVTRTLLDTMLKEPA